MTRDAQGIAARKGLCRGHRGFRLNYRPTYKDVRADLLGGSPIYDNSEIPRLFYCPAFSDKTEMPDWDSVFKFVDAIVDGDLGHLESVLGDYPHYRSALTRRLGYLMAKESPGTVERQTVHTETVSKHNTANGLSVTLELVFYSDPPDAIRVTIRRGKAVLSLIEVEDPEKAPRIIEHHPAIYRACGLDPNEYRRYVPFGKPPST